MTASTPSTMAIIRQTNVFWRPSSHMFRGHETDLTTQRLLLPHHWRLFRSSWKPMSCEFVVWRWFLLPVSALSITALEILEKRSFFIVILSFFICFVQESKSLHDVSHGLTSGSSMADLWVNGFWCCFGFGFIFFSSILALFVLLFVFL